MREGGQRRQNQFYTISTKISVSHKYKYKNKYKTNNKQQNRLIKISTLDQYYSNTNTNTKTNTRKYEQIVIEERRSEEAKPAHYELASRSADSPLPVGRVGSAISNYLREA